MALTVNTRIALGNQNDLTTPTSTQEYKLGSMIEIQDDDTKSVKKYMYVKAHAALTQYQPYVIKDAGTAGAEKVTAAPTTLASAVNLVGVPQVAFTSDYYGFIQTEGKGTAVLSGSTSYVAGNALELATSGSSFIADSTGTVPTINTAAYLITATTGTSGAVILPGNRIEIAST